MGNSQHRRLEERIAREILLALGLLAIALTQTSLLPRPFSLVINLILYLTVLQGLSQDAGGASRWALYGGLCLDLCSDTLLGVHTLALLAAMLVPTFALTRLSRTNLLLPLFALTLGMLTYHGVLGLFTWLLLGPMPILTYLTVTILPDLALSLIAALPLFLILRWIDDQRRRMVPIDVY